MDDEDCFLSDSVVISVVVEIMVSLENMTKVLVEQITNQQLVFLLIMATTIILCFI